MKRIVKFVAGCIVLVLSVGLLAASAPRMVITPIEDVRFKPGDPTRANAIETIVLRGDPAAGQSSMYMRMGKSTGGGLHVHTSDYDAVVIKGEAKHWQRGETEANATVLKAGSYWFQPGGQPHGDSCLTNECIYYLQWSGKSDSRAVD